LIICILYALIAAIVINSMANIGVVFGEEQQMLTVAASTTTETNPKSKKRKM
jgi:hypothetical protein